MGMKSMYELRDMLCDELDEIAKRVSLARVIWISRTNWQAPSKIWIKSRRWKMAAIPEPGISRVGIRTTSTEAVAPMQEAESITSVVITAATAHATE